MIEIDSDVKEGDIVYMWFSMTKEPIKKSMQTKHTEVEYKVLYRGKNRFQVHSTNGDYQLMFTDDLLMNMFGSCRKAT